MTTTFDVQLGPRPAVLRWAAGALWWIEHEFERARAEGRADDAKLRIFFITVIFGLAFLSLAIGATRAALFAARADGDEAAAQPQGARADLTDRNGQLLAVDLPYYGLYVNRDDIWDVEETRRRLAPFLPPASILRLEKTLAAHKRTQVMSSLTPQQKAAIADMGLPGISFEPEARRNYPLGSTAAHLIGFAGQGGAGVSGIELALDKTIRAQAGQGPLALSIDLRVQAALEDEVIRAAVDNRAAAAVGIVTNVRTGEVLGLVSYPDYNPNAIGASDLSNQVNHAAASVYEMGSIFKVFSVATGLDSGSATLSSTFDARYPLTFGGNTIHDYHAENKIMTLAEVFEHSSNIGTSRLALLIGRDNFTKYFRNFGLFAPAPIELTESRAPFPATLFKPTAKWADVTVATVSFGHGMAVTPLAVAASMGGILNGGNYVPLTVLKRDPNQPIKGRRVVSEQTSRTMLELMRMNAEHGTGSKAEAEAPGLRIGGKTGTADKAENGHYGTGKKVSSFASIFPSDGPINADRYFVLVLLDEPHGTAQSGGVATGGMVSAPPAGRVINRIAPFLGVSRFAVAPKVLDAATEKMIGAEQ
ncbi:penicillin-binding protein 2 [soil metagenome]